MKIIIDNKSIVENHFSSLTEAKNFLNSHRSVRTLFLDETFGEHHHALNIVHSLTGETLLNIGYSSEKSPDELKLLIWDKSNRLVVETDESIYILSIDGEIIEKIEIITPVVSLYLIRGNLLLVEESGIKVVDQQGAILVDKATDLISQLSLNGDKLIISTLEGDKLEVAI